MDMILAESVTATLISWWKMLLMVPPFIAWAWLVSAKLDKDASFFHLNQPLWNSIQLTCGVAALAAMLFIPIFWVSWPIGVILLLAPVIAYWQFRNNQVPAEERFELSTLSLGAKLDERRQARAARAAVIQFTNKQGDALPVPQKDDPQHEVHMVAEDLLGPAMASRASKVELGLGPKGCVVSQSIDGVRYKRDALPTELSLQLFAYLKALGALNVEDQRRNQTSDFSMEGPNGKTHVAITTWGSSSGHNMRLEFDRAKRLIKPFDGLGLISSQLDGLRSLEEPHNRHGLILIGAPSGHGLTTSAYSFVGRHDAYTSNIKTLELEVQVEIDGVDQIQHDPTNPDIDYATALQSILRRDPDIVLTDRITESQSAGVATDPGMKGPLIYIPQALGTIAEQIRLWVKQVGDVKKAVRSLRAVTNQRLLRTLCSNCRQTFTPTAEQLKKLNIPAGKVNQLHSASGKVQVKNKIENCPVCAGSGYLGQTAAFEVMILDDQSRKLLASGDLKGAMAHARRNRMVYLQEAALSKVISGETTIEEVIRATAPTRNDTPPPKPKPMATA
jgi:type II secretory ATPase GspE/PulE/Tfp pilus assembly ATPase PilB-like protein